MAVAEQVEVLDAAPTLDELARILNHELDVFEETGVSLLESAIRVGEALLAAKRQVPHGKWRRWLNENCVRAETTATTYMRIARYQDVVRGRATSVISASKMLRGRPCAGNLELPSGFASEVADLREEGMAISEIAHIVGVSHQTVRQILDPTAKERHRRNQRGRVALSDTDRAIVRRAGGGLPGVRTNILRCLSGLQKEMEEESVSAVRADIESVMHRLYAAEDQLLKAANARIEAREAERRND